MMNINRLDEAGTGEHLLVVTARLEQIAYDSNY